jgi:hypothetical protein
MPSCYGCHVEMNYSKDGRVQTSGERRKGRPKGERFWVELEDQVLMRNPFGKIAPSMPAERFFLTVKDKNGETILDKAPRRNAEGGLGFGQRTVSPHTIQKISNWSQCGRCHIKSDGSNEDQVRIAVGLGSDRYLFTDGEGTEHKLDAIIEENGDSLVTVKHIYPMKSGPLEKELRDKLLTEPVK